MSDMDVIKCVLWSAASAVYFAIIPALSAYNFTLPVEPGLLSPVYPSISNFIDTPQASGLMGVLVMGMLQYLWHPIYRTRWYYENPSGAIWHDVLVGLTVLGFAGFLTCALSYDAMIPMEAHFTFVGLFLICGFIHMAILFYQVLHRRTALGMNTWTVGLGFWCTFLIIGGCGFLGMLGIGIFWLLRPSFDFSNQPYYFLIFEELVGLSFAILIPLHYCLASRFLGIHSPRGSPVTGIAVSNSTLNRKVMMTHGHVDGHERPEEVQQQVAGNEGEADSVVQESGSTDNPTTITTIFSTGHPSENSLHDSVV